MVESQARCRFSILHPALALLCAVAISLARVHSACATGDIPVGGIELRIQPPLPIWPSDYETITERSPAFRINGRFPATRYRVELARDADFSRPLTMIEFRVADTSGITPVVLVPLAGEPLPDGQYYWRAFCGDDSGFTTPAANYRTFFISDKDADAVVSPAGLSHPYLLLSPSEVQSVRDKIAGSDHFRRGWQYQLNAAYSALELEPVTESYAKGGVGQHGNYSTCAGWYHRHLENVAFVAVITGDERLVRKGVEMLMTACVYERWLGPLFDNPKHFDPPWRSALETAMMTEAVAVGYDLLYPHLTDTQRETVRHALAEKGIRMLVHDWADPVGSSQIPRHQVPTGNWVMVCSASAGLGALAILDEHPEAPQWARLVRNRVRAWLHDRGGDWYVDNPWPVNRPKPIPVIGPSEPNFGRDGGYKESIGYMNYGTRYVCDFANSLRRVTGENLFTHVPENLLDHMAWSIMAWQENGAIKSALIDFGDEGGTTAWYGDLLACLMRNRGDGLAAWLYRRICPVPSTPRMLLWSDETLTEKAPLGDGSMRIFRDIGQVIMRQGWGPGDPMAAIKFHQNRGHHDIGTFYLFGAGGPTIIDSGSTNYNSPIYGKHLAWTAAHNVVMVDNENQTRADGQMLGAVGAGLISGVSGQLKAAYPDKLESWTRDVVMLPDAVVVHDNLVAKGQRRFDLVLHPENPFELTGRDELTIGRGPSSVRIQVAGGADLKAVIQDGYHRTLPRKYVRFNAGAPVEQAMLVMVCRWPARLAKTHQATQGSAAPSQSPQTRQTSSPRPGAQPVLNPRTGWRLPPPRERSGFAVVADSMPALEDNLAARSDARLAAVSKCEGADGSLCAVMLAGMRLSVDARELIRTSQPVDMAIELGARPCAQVSTPSPVRLTVGLREPVDDVYAEGAPIKASRDGHTVSFAVPAGQTRLTFGSPEVRHANPGSDLIPVAASNAQVFQDNVRTRASSSWTDGVDALDGDINTGWVSLPGLPMPQWLEVRLPNSASMTRMEIRTGLPAAGRLEAWDGAANDWKLLDRFETASDRPSATISFDRVKANRLRAVIERIDPANQSATINEWRWMGSPSGD